MYVNHSLKEKGEPRQEIEPTASVYQPNALPLGHSGSLTGFLLLCEPLEGQRDLWPGTLPSNATAAVTPSQSCHCVPCVRPCCQATEATLIYLHGKYHFPALPDAHGFMIRNDFFSDHVCVDKNYMSFNPSAGLGCFTDTLGHYVQMPRRRIYFLCLLS